MIRVALFIPCFVDQLAPAIGQAAVRVLERAGCAVEFPEAQTCCGQPAFSTGHWREARDLAVRFVRVFAAAEAVVCPSGSCAATARRAFALLGDGDAPWRGDAAALAPRVFEFSEFLVRRLRLTDVGAFFPHRVAYHDACHLLRELGVRDEPRQLLREVRGLELVEMEEPEECCGFGGAFAVALPAISAALGRRKAANVERAQAEFVTAGDPSCLLHIGGVLARQGARARAIHLAEILAAERRPAVAPARP